MNMFEEARSLAGTMKMCKLTQGGLAKRLGVSQAYVANKLRLLTYSCDMQKRILDAGLTERHARAVLRLRNDEARASALERIIRDKLTVRESEAVVDIMFDSYMPIYTERAVSSDMISTFKGLINSSLKTLRSHGIKAREHIDFYGKKTYITISIDEG